MADALMRTGDVRTEIRSIDRSLSVRKNMSSSKVRSWPARRLQVLTVQMASVQQPRAERLQQPLDYARQALLRPGALESFDQEAWERDGFVVFPGGLTQWATAQFSSALRRVQAIDDHIILQTDCQLQLR